MEGFNYIVGIVSIVIGLALAEIAQDLPQLIRRRRGERIDPLVAGSSFFILLTLISTWFDIWAIRAVPDIRSFPLFTLLFIHLILLYLLASACLPTKDEDSAGLARFYENQRRYLWGLYFAYELVYGFFWIYLQTRKGVPPLDLLLRGYEVLVPLTIAALLFSVRDRRLHTAGIAVLIVQLLAGYWTYRVG